MKLCEIRIKPKSFFGTPLKGDTIFGHFCWQAKYDPDLLNGGLDYWISRYGEKPFAVFSSAWPVIKKSGDIVYAVKRPDYPLKFFSKSESQDRRKFYEERKEKLKKRWMLVGKDLKVIATHEFLKTDKEIMASIGEGSIKEEFAQPHNTINRLTMTTGEGEFAPYVKRNFSYYPGLELAVFALFDEEATDLAGIKRGFERMGLYGYGRDASTGLGRFDVLSVEEMKLPGREGADGCYTLSPSIPEKGRYKEIYFAPFTRFGRHGDILATSANPFKAPVIMADEGAVLIPEDESVWEKNYVGQAIGRISRVSEETVAQGYSIYLPIRLE